MSSLALSPSFAASGSFPSLDAYSAPFSPVAELSSGSAYVAGSNRAQAIPADQHKLNVDPNPTVIRKRPTEKVHYTQNVSLKYLKPPPAPQPGDITIEQEPDVQIPPAPPLVVKQKPSGQPSKPAPAVIRERPPQPPAPIPPKHITIPGKVLPPPPRKVITERFAPAPAQPQDVIIERWLGYDRRTRNVVFRPAAPIQPLPAPKNVLIEWEAAEADIRQEVNYLGVEVVDPSSYLSQHGSSLVDASRIPAVASKFQVPSGERLAADSNPNELPRLTGDLQALRLVNLDCHGLGAYRGQF